MTRLILVLSFFLLVACDDDTGGGNNTNNTNSTSNNVTNNNNNSSNNNVVNNTNHTSTTSQNNVNNTNTTATNNQNNTTPVCGDGAIDAGEECDSDQLGGETCESNGYMGGVLSCTASCVLDFSACGDSLEEIVCNRWNADRADRSEGTWSGDAASCSAGDISADGRANALKLVNLYRFLADLPAVTTDPVKNQKAQECALMMTANGQLSHSPPTSWDCYTADGAQAAGSSNLASTAGVAAVDLYMVDPGNPNTLGHRRWILSNSFGPTGLGSTNSYSCMWAFGSGNAGKTYTAWPPAGYFPAGAVDPSWTSIDQTGWTLQSDSINLSGAVVTITMDGSVDRPVSVTQLLANYGSSYAISMIPDGWTTEAGHTYHVEVTNISTPISYDVNVVSCP